MPKTAALLQSSSEGGGNSFRPSIPPVCLSICSLMVEVAMLVLLEAGGSGTAIADEVGDDEVYSSHDLLAEGNFDDKVYSIRRQLNRTIS
jgi:hypothetical protein